MLLLILNVWILLVFLMASVWLIAFYYKNPSIVDVFWSLGLWLSGLTYLSLTPWSVHSYIFATLLTLWSIRLSSYLFFTRIKRGIVDKRYLTLHKQNETVWLKYFFNFQLQAILIFIIALPFLFIAEKNQFNLISIIGIALVIIGIIGESIADYQAYQFKQLNPGKVCNIKLWHYSRHPNYFFDWVMWVGFAVAGISSLIDSIAIISPLTLYIVMTKLTGPLTEALSLQTKGDDYRQYQRKTAMFFPWFNKR